MCHQQRQTLADLSATEVLIVQSLRALSSKELATLDQLEQELKLLIGIKSGQKAFFDLCRLGKFFGRYGRRPWLFGMTGGLRLTESEVGVLNLLSTHKNDQPQRAMDIARWFFAQAIIQNEVSELARTLSMRLPRQSLDVPERAVMLPPQQHNPNLTLRLAASATRVPLQSI